MALEKGLSEQEIKEIYAEEESYKFFGTGKISKLLTHVLLGSEVGKFGPKYLRFRDVQKRAFLALLDMLSQGIDEGVGKLPTGAGKTIYFTAVSRSLQNISLVKSDTADVLAQNMRSLYESGYRLDQLFSIPHHVYNPQTYRFEPKGNKSAGQMLKEIIAIIQENNIEDAVISCTYASLKSLYKNYRELLDQLNEILGDYVSDEAHNTTGPLGSEMKEYFMDREKGNPKGKIHQLMTATPDRATHSLRDVHHMMIDVKLQECFEDGTLIRPSFIGVGNSYLPTEKRTRLPSNLELETYGKYIDENSRPIREVIADRYVEEKEKFPYCPAMFFCGSIKEATDMQTYFTKTHPHVRTVRATSEDTITLGEIEDLIYADKVDVVLTVTRLAVGGDIRPLRVVGRLNASNDPVMKTQGNGRILRTMPEKDVERFFAVLRKKKLYDSYSDEDLRNNIRKTTENTFIIEPDKWIVFAPEGGMMLHMGIGGGKPGKTKGDKLEELPNSMEDMLLSDEVNHNYVTNHYPHLSFNFQDIADFFASHNIHSAKDLLVTNPHILLGEMRSVFRGSKYKKIAKILNSTSLEEINAAIQSLGRTPLKETDLQEALNQSVQKLNKKDVFELYDFYKGKRDEKDPDSYIPHYFIWQLMHGRNRWLSEDEKNFEWLVSNVLQRDVQKEFLRYIKGKSAITLIKKGEAYRDKIEGIVNVIRKVNDKNTFRNNVTSHTFFSYVFEVAQIPGPKEAILALLQKRGVKTPRDIFTLNREDKSLKTLFMDKEIRKYLDIEHHFDWTNTHGSYWFFGKWLITRLYGRATAKAACADHLAYLIKLNFEGDIFDLANYMSGRLTKKAVIAATGVPQEELWKHKDIFQRIALYVLGEENIDKDNFESDTDIALVLLKPWSYNEVVNKVRKRRKQMKKKQKPYHRQHWRNLSEYDLFDSLSPDIVRKQTYLHKNRPGQYPLLVDLNVEELLQQ